MQLLGREVKDGPWCSEIEYVESRYSSRPLSYQDEIDESQIRVGLIHQISPRRPDVPNQSAQTGPRKRLRRLPLPLTYRRLRTAPRTQLER